MSLFTSMQKLKCFYIRVLTCVCVLLAHMSVVAQSTDKNYVRRVDILKAYESDCDEDLGDDEQLLHRKTWQFYDDLGRPTVEARGGVNLNGTYAMSMVEYDKRGRKMRSWSPFEGGTSADFSSESALQSQSSQWYGDEYGYTHYVSCSWNYSWWSYWLCCGRNSR